LQFLTAFPICPLDTCLASLLFLLLLRFRLKKYRSFCTLEEYIRMINKWSS
jgi:hypothetical protein